MFSDDFGADDSIGRIKISCADIIANPDDPTSWRYVNVPDDDQPEERDAHWFPLVARGSKKLNGGFIRMTIVFKPVGVCAVRDSISDCYFSLLKYNHVTLYQDAETPHDPLFDEIAYDDGSTYEPTNCWKDIYRSLREAQKVIYMTGWSVWTEVVLVRDDGEDQVTLGDLLMQKVMTTFLYTGK